MGNASLEAMAHRGWFLGHFIEAPDDLRATSTLELKWADYETGESRATWAVNQQATTLSILIRGQFRLRFLEQEVVLQQEGDYALWLPGVAHSWFVEAPSTILTVRWPSLPGDSLPSQG